MPLPCLWAVRNQLEMTGADGGKYWAPTEPFYLLRGKGNIALNTWMSAKIIGSNSQRPWEHTESSILQRLWWAIVHLLNPICIAIFIPCRLNELQVFRLFSLTFLALCGRRAIILQPLPHACVLPMNLWYSITSGTT